MRYLTFGEEKTSYKLCILVNDIRKDEIKRAYIDPYGLDEAEILVLSLHQAPGKKKTPAAEMKAYITEELKPLLEDYGIEYLIVGDGDYFKTLTKSAKVDAMIGYVLPTEFGDWRVAYVPNFRTIFYDPVKVTDKIATGIEAMKAWMAGTYRDPGIDIIEFAAYPQTVEEIRSWLRKLHTYPALTVDIEAFSLKHYDAGIGTIQFAWSKTEGIAFAVDYAPGEWIDEDGVTYHGRQVPNLEVRALLKEFFETYQGTLLYHSISYDVYVLIYQLFMEHLLDNGGLLYGLQIMLKDWHDTKLITYLATNSCAGNKLGLKDQAQEYAGNYAQDEIKDIRKIPLPQLLQYNLVDGLSTWFTFEKHWQTVIDDNQLDIYNNIFKPATIDIIQMQLTGMPMDMEQVGRVKQVLQAICDDAMDRIKGSPLVQAYSNVLADKWVEKRNQELKKKRVTTADYKEEFNPNSSDQLIGLLYETLGLPVLSRTKSKQPATGAKTLELLKNHTQDSDLIALLDALVDYKAVNKILTDFIPSFENAQMGPDGWYYLFGNFNLGGTLSGRLSSSGPNLQNLPANVEMVIRDHLLKLYHEILGAYVKKGKLSLGKLIKSCFKAPPGWFFCGIDFASLEDRISALTTKDPNKLKVYTDGYDGHCLRAHAYFGDQMPDIDPTTVEGINLIEVKYKDLRQKSKNPTFALTYQGDYGTLMRNYNFPEELARKCEASYQELYRVSVDWVNAKLDQAMTDGYITAAFGLRVRTPLLKQVVRKTSKTPYEAEAEGRSAGNALGQSWCLLNSRAGSEFMGKVRDSDQRHAIRPCAQIHDAQYFLVKDDIDAIRYANEHVVKACQWQDHPDIWHDTVKLGGEFSIFWPDWSQEVSLPNGASEAEILAAFEKHVQELNQKG